MLHPRKSRLSTIGLLLVALTGCIDWEDKSLQDGGGSIEGADDGGGQNGTGNANGNDPKGTGDGGGNGDNTGTANGGEIDAGSQGPECSAELCNQQDDDCDTTIDEECTNVDDCATLPCKNGGTCADGDGTFTCTCAGGFEGPTCETNADECMPNPCQNGGTCADGANGFTCSCPKGFQGERCEINNDDCDPNPCRNGGTCRDGVDGAVCTCLPGYEGTQCETNINECSPNPCQNGGVCKDGINESTCTCPAGFSGKKCETNINDCASNPCKNGGACVDGVNTSTCKCTADHTGPLCEYEICGDTTIRSKAEFVQNRLCKEIRGKLTIDAGGNFDSITANDLPFLTQVSGDVLISGLMPAASDQPWGTITFPLLEKVNGNLMIGGLAITQAKLISFPALRSVGGVVGTSGTRALDMLFTAAIAIDFPMLTTINGSVRLSDMNELCSANLRNLTTVSGSLEVYNLPKLPTAHIQTLLAGSAMDGTPGGIGCCILGDGLACTPGAYDPFSAACRCLQ